MYFGLRPLLISLSGLRLPIYGHMPTGPGGLTR